ncbi:MAG: hypothetical protein WDZ79_00145, partial [Candidatus Paceibacterota bacterium]
SGKTTISKALARELTKLKLRTLTVADRQRYFLSFSPLYRHLYPILFDLKDTLRTLTLLFIHRHLYCNYASSAGALRQMWGRFKKRTVDRFLSNVASFDCYVREDGILHPALSFSPGASLHACEQLASLSPGETVVFVFVDLDPNVAFERMALRGESLQSDHIERALKARGVSDVRGHYDTVYTKTRDVYTALKKKEGWGNIAAVLSVDGRLSPESNAAQIARNVQALLQRLPDKD